MNSKITAFAALTAALALFLTACGKPAESSREVPETEGTEAIEAAETAEETQASAPHLLLLDGKSATLDGAEVPEYDYVWRADPSLAEPEFTGTEPDGTLPAYIAHDVIYYPRLPASSFEKENYDGETEWVTRYTAEGLEEYIFGTLPVLGTELPEEMTFTAEEAYANPVLHITQPGEYVLEGSFEGQLFFDFGDGDETFADEAASVTLTLNGANVTCGVAPAIVFHDVYECDNEWENRESHTDEIDLSAAGVKIVLADGTENNFSGCNVYRLLKPEYKKDGSAQKKLWKTDGAFYSFQSMLIDGQEKGTGILNVTSRTFEGLDSELHLTIDGGYVNIFSQDDGINVNEDHVSVFTMNGGHLTIFAGLGAEGDVIDSNGFIRVNGGVIAGTSKSPSDDMLDSEDGTYQSENATVYASGSAGAYRDVPGEMPEGGFGERPDFKPDGAPEIPEGGFGGPGEAPPDDRFGNFGEETFEKPDAAPEKP